MIEDFSDIISVFDGGIRIPVKAKPNRPRKAKPKIVDIAEGKRAIEIAISAIAEDGKANKAIIEYIAHETKIKKSDIYPDSEITRKRA